MDYLIREFELELKDEVWQSDNLIMILSNVFVMIMFAGVVRKEKYDKIVIE